MKIEPFLNTATILGAVLGYCGFAFFIDSEHMPYKLAAAVAICAGATFGVVFGAIVFGIVELLRMWFNRRP